MIKDWSISLSNNGHVTVTVDGQEYDVKDQHVAAVRTTIRQAFENLASSPVPQLLASKLMKIKIEKRPKEIVHLHRLTALEQLADHLQRAEDQAVEDLAAERIHLNDVRQAMTAFKRLSPEAKRIADETWSKVNK